MRILLLVVILLVSGCTYDLNYKYYNAEGISMEPTIKANERLAVDQNYYDSNKIERGDIVIFTAPNNSTYVKRVIGLSGDKVKIENNKVYINGKELEEIYIQNEVKLALENGEIYNPDLFEVEVPTNSIYVLGDNRKNSVDSRQFGPISIDNVSGKVIEIK